MVTAKNEYVTVFHTSEAGSSQSTAHEESAGPGQVQVVLLAQPERPCSRETACFAKGWCWEGAPQSPVGLRVIVVWSTVNYNLLWPHHARAIKGTKAKLVSAIRKHQSSYLLVNSTQRFLVSIPGMFSQWRHFWGSAFFHTNGVPHLGGCKPRRTKTFFGWFLLSLGVIHMTKLASPALPWILPGHLHPPLEMVCIEPIGPCSACLRRKEIYHRVFFVCCYCL